MRIDFHTASCAEVPHVAVFSCLPDGSEDERLADFYIVGQGDQAVHEAEVRALAFIDNEVRCGRAAYQWVTPP